MENVVLLGVIFTRSTFVAPMGRYTGMNASSERWILALSPFFFSLLQKMLIYHIKLLLVCSQALFGYFEYLQLFVCRRRPSAPHSEVSSYLHYMMF